MDLLEDWNNIVSDDVANPNAEDDPDIFDLALLRDFMSRGRGTPVAVALSGDTLVVATSRNFLLRADLSDGGQASVVEIDLQRPGDAVCRQVWLDPSGSHCLVAASAATGAPETLYVDSAWKKARILSKMKGMALTAVAWWPSLQPSHTTRPVLLGTDSGTLVSLDLADPRKERVQPLHSLQGQSVHSVEQTVSPATGKLLVLALTPSHIHCFHGEGSLQDCFSDTIGSPTGLELPSAPGPTQMTLLFGEPDPAAASRSNAGPEGALLSQPSGIAVLCPDGIFQATLQPDAPGLASDPSAALTRHHLLPLDVVWPGGRAALSLAATRFHFALLSAAALTLVNRVSKRRVQDLVLSRYAAPLRDVAELPLGLVPDTQRGGRVCLWAGDDLFELDAGSEDRDMWRTFLDAGEFGAALLHCSTAAQRSAVFLAQGEAAVEGGDWEAAGTLFGKVTLTEPSFEDLALRFMDAAQPGALQRFLQVRLETLGRDDQVQATMVATWLLELLLDKQNRAALGASEDTGEGAGAGGASELEQVEAELAAFLRKHVRVLDAGTTTSLLSGYGQPGLLEVFAASRGDHETVLELLVQQGQVTRALEVLRSPAVSPELAYKFAPALAALAPEESVRAWVAANPPLDPERLLPALLALSSGARADATSRAAALSFVRAALDAGAGVQALHDLALDLYSALDGGEEQLMEYLRTARSPLGRPLFDPVLALRLARERGRDHAAVALYQDLGLHDDAVRLALTLDRDLAVRVAGRAGGDAGLSRRLWLDIAGHLIQASGDPKDQAQGIALVTSLLEESGGLLRIEDVLPLFPDFVEIDAFKDVLCTALEAYNQEIEDLKREMAVSSETAHAIRKSLGALEVRVGVLDGAERCARCGRSLQGPPPLSAGPSGGAVPQVYLFPTGNAFHGSCLAAEVAALAPALQRRRIGAALAELAAGRDVARHLADLNADVASEDPYWGEAMVRQVRTPFLDGPDAAAELASWAL
uniref:Pep3/Vps18 beta-propeller domain-containing protein n=1 Tax=Auxenochlorella protothecoides TaxID=3075 RepID=A0A1D2AFE6_AUXPR